jgi:hypothetical protein
MADAHQDKLQRLESTHEGEVAGTRQLWDVVEFGDAEFHEDRLALDALLASVPPEMASSLADKPTAKDAWDSIIVASRIGNDRV